MKFPGSKLLHEWDLSVQRMSFDDLLNSCRQAGLTGLAEVRIQDGMGLIFYYMGGEINALFREGATAHNGQAALERLRARSAGGTGSVSVYELPLDMAHLLRGMTNRKRMKERVRSQADFEELLRGLERAEHTGTLEIQTQTGAAMVLLVRGRVSNVYWEAQEGSRSRRARLARNSTKHWVPTTPSSSSRVLSGDMEDPPRGAGRSAESVGPKGRRAAAGP